MAKLPSVTITLGSMSSSWRSRYGQHEAISSGSRIAIPRRPALDDVGDVEVPPRQPHLLEHEAVEQLARSSDERETLLVLLGAGTLAHEHQVGVGLPMPNTT